MEERICREARGVKPIIKGVALNYALCLWNYKIIIERQYQKCSNFDRGVLTQMPFMFKIVCFYTKTSAFSS